MSAGPRRIQLRRTKGWRKPPDAIVVARPTKWGNPYAVGDGADIHVHADAFSATIELDADLAVVLYRELMRVRLWYPGHPEDDAYTQGWVDGLVELAGHDLCCWCPLDQPCHADVLLELANP